MLFVSTLLGMLVVALALAGVAIAFLWRQTKDAGALIRGLRADVDHIAGEFVRHGTEGQQLETAVQQAIGVFQQRLAITHNVAATAIDRILYYTRRDKGLAKLGQAYDRAIEKLRAKAEAEAKAAERTDVAVDVPQSATPAQPADVDVIETNAEETTDDDMAKIVGSIGGMPCG